jgi:hypothetical protein
MPFLLVLMSLLLLLQMFSMAPLKPEDVKYTERPVMVNDRGY